MCGQIDTSSSGSVLWRDSSTSLCRIPVSASSSRSGKAPSPDKMQSLLTAFFSGFHFFISSLKEGLQQRVSVIESDSSVPLVLLFPLILERQESWECAGCWGLKCPELSPASAESGLHCSLHSPPKHLPQCPYQST